MIRDQTLALMLVAMARSVGGKPLSVHHTAATEACQTTSRTCHPCNTNGCEVLKKAEASSAGDCCDQCTKTAGCASWTYNTKPGQVPCHLKSTVNFFFPDGWVDPHDAAVGRCWPQSECDMLTAIALHCRAVPSASGFLSKQSMATNQFFPSCPPHPRSLLV